MSRTGLQVLCLIAAVFRINRDYIEFAAICFQSVVSVSLQAVNDGYMTSIAMIVPVLMVDLQV